MTTSQATAAYMDIAPLPSVRVSSRIRTGANCSSLLAFGPCLPKLLVKSIFNRTEYEKAGGPANGTVKQLPQ